MKIKNLLVNANNGDSEHIGVIRAYTNETLKAKLVKACEEHWDESVVIPEIDFQTIEHGKKVECEIQLPFSCSSHNIIIEQTWIY